MAGPLKLCWLNGLVYAAFFFSRRRPPTRPPAPKPKSSNAPGAGTGVPPDEPPDEPPVLPPVDVELVLLVDEVEDVEPPVDVELVEPPVLVLLVLDVLVEPPVDVDVELVLLVEEEEPPDELFDPLELLELPHFDQRLHLLDLEEPYWPPKKNPLFELLLVLLAWAVCVVAAMVPAAPTAIIEPTATALVSFAYFIIYLFEIISCITKSLSFHIVNDIAASMPKHRNFQKSLKAVG